MKKEICSYLPNYAYIPLILVLIINFITYNFSKLITNSFVHYNISSFIDDFLPFFPVFIIFYLLAYFQWIIGFILIARESREFCFRFLSAEIIAKLCCLLLFFVFPTTMIRPEITGTGIFDFLTKKNLNMPLKKAGALTHIIFKTIALHKKINSRRTKVPSRPSRRIRRSLPLRHWRS